MSRKGHLSIIRPPNIDRNILDEIKTSTVVNRRTHPFRSLRTQRYDKNSMFCVVKDTRKRSTTIWNEPNDLAPQKNAEERVSPSLAKKVEVQRRFSLNRAEGLATKPYHARFVIPCRKGWGTVLFFTKSCWRAGNEALSRVFRHPSPKRLGDGAVFL